MSCSWCKSSDHCHVVAVPEGEVAEPHESRMIVHQIQLLNPSCVCVCLVVCEFVSVCVCGVRVIR